MRRELSYLRPIDIAFWWCELYMYYDQLLQGIVVYLIPKYRNTLQGARSEFCRVIEGKMSSAGQLTVPGRRPADVCTHKAGHRTIFV